MHILKWIEISDIVDVALVAVLIYIGLLWFKRTRAFLVVVGIIILGCVYALARYMDLFLTTAMLRGFFAVLLIAIIVIFQEDLRQFFEQIALWGLGRRKTLGPKPLIEALVRTAGDFARGHIGALIVISGRDPIERHIEGGIELDGKPSESLFKSIFDTHTPGHDGAVYIKDGKIIKFAAHLPLSKDFEKLTGTGTRHAAALGLSERCDALCIVVSEERGVVSIARDGNLTQIKDVERLGPIIEGYFREKFPPKQKKRISNYFCRNKREKITAVVLAAALWMAFAYRAGIVQRDFSIPIEYMNLPPEVSIEKAVPREITVTLSADERAFRQFNRDELKVRLNLLNAREGKWRIPVKEESVSRLPHNVSVEEIRPSEVELTLKKDAGGKLAK